MANLLEVERPFSKKDFKERFFFSIFLSPKINFVLCVKYYSSFSKEYIANYIQMSLLHLERISPISLQLEGISQ